MEPVGRDRIARDLNRAEFRRNAAGMVLHNTFKQQGINNRVLGQPGDALLRLTPAALTVASSDPRI